MAFVEHVVRRVSQVVARSVVELGARQDPDAPTGTASTSPLPTSTSDTQPTPPPNDDGKNNDDGSSTSPLLFFVALGFGVVFTNLWIIVGVKYCFRYNARARALRSGASGDEPINMDNMTRPRRRREKKLMTMDEVNEKFPMMKYKNWVSSRAVQGLPTSGGVSSPPSRSGSIRSVDAASPELPSKERESTDERPASRASRKQADASVAPAAAETKPDKDAREMVVAVAVAAAGADGAAEPPSAGKEARAAAPASKEVASDAAGAASDPDEPRRSEADEDGEEHILAALPIDWYGKAGDTCAICIDTLEDDDDIRGLACGHVFHAVCVDPWLTSRRACCPLCKADYYTPKPRPQPDPVPAGAAPAASAPGDGASGEAPRAPRFRPGAAQPAGAPAAEPPPSTLRRFGRFMLLGPGGRRQPQIPPAARRPSGVLTTADAAAANGPRGSGMAAIGRMNWTPPWSRSRPSEGSAGAATAATLPAAGGPVASGAAGEPTPSQLEAGTRS